MGESCDTLEEESMNVMESPLVYLPIEIQNHAICEDRYGNNLLFGPPGCTLVDIFTRGVTMSVTSYCVTLERLQKVIRWKRLGLLSRGVIPLYDNVRSA